MVPVRCRAAWKVYAPSASLPWSLTRSHCTTNTSPGVSTGQVTQRSTKGQKSNNKRCLNVTLWLTIVQVLHNRLLGEAGVKVGHEGGDVLCGCQHAMSDLPREDEPFERSKVQTSEELGESLNFLHCYVWHPNNMINKTGKQDPKVQTSRDWKKHTCTKVFHHSPLLCLAPQ